MRVGLVVPGFSADEGDWCIPALRHLVRQLARIDQVRVFTLRYPYQAGSYDAFGARVIALGGGPRRRLGSAVLWERALFTLALEHRREPFDVLHGFWATESGALAAVVGRVLGVPTVVSLAGGELVGFRDLGYGDQLWWTQRLKVAMALRLADVVTAGSAYLLALARPRLRTPTAERLVQAPLGVDACLFRPETRPALNDPPCLVHVGSLTPVKDQATLLSTVARLRGRGVAVRLEIAGSGRLKPTLISLATDLRIEESVQFWDEVPHSQLPRFYRQGDVFVLSSRHEAQCMAALEAASCGLPVVGTAVGIVPELASDASLAVATGDPGDLADAIGRLLSDSVLWRELGRSARARVETEFELSRCVDRFRQVYRQVAALRGHGVS